MLRNILSHTRPARHLSPADAASDLTTWHHQTTWPFLDRVWRGYQELPQDRRAARGDCWHFGAMAAAIAVAGLLGATPTGWDDARLSNVAHELGFGQARGWRSTSPENVWLAMSAVAVHHVVSTTWAGATTSPVSAEDLLPELDLLLLDRDDWLVGLLRIYATAPGSAVLGGAWTPSTAMLGAELASLRGEFVDVLAAMDEIVVDGFSDDLLASVWPGIALSTNATKAFHRHLSMLARSLEEAWHQSQPRERSHFLETVLSVPAPPA